MAKFEYKSIPAPKKGEKAKGVKGSDGRIAQAMTSALNEMGALGWEYLRADTLPLEERSGLTSKAVHYYTVLVFRREIAAAVDTGPSLDVEMTDAEHAHIDAPVETSVDDEATVVVAPADGTPRPSLTATRTP